MTRKNGFSPAVEHSIRVGRSLKDRNYDDITVVGGYLHDIYEDTDTTIGDVYHLCQAFFLNNKDATAATELVHDVSYRQFEYALGRDGRKASATKRWLDTVDIKIVRVKIADIEDNMSCVGPDVDQEFAQRYLSWAEPTLEALRKREREIDLLGKK